MQNAIEDRELTTEDKEIIGRLLFEALAGEISQATREAAYKLGDPLKIPEPYSHLIAYTQGFALDNKSLAHELQDELRIVCMELLDPNYPPKE